jgi:hypothetical protein
MLRIALGLVLLMAGAAVPLQAVPAPPSALTGSVSGSTVTLSWTGPSGAVAGYRLEAGTAPGLANVASSVVGVAATFTAAGVPAGTYYVRVRAIAADGESAPSNEVTLVVGAGAGDCASAPSAPGTLAAVVSANSPLVALAWSAPASGCAPSGYMLQVGSAPGLSNLVTMPVGGTSFSASAPAGTYYLRVVAVNNFGTSVPSNELIVSVGGAANGQVEVNQSTAAIGQDSQGNTVVIGEVTNRTSAAAVFVEVALTMRGANGAVIATDATFVRGRSRRLTATGTYDDSALAPGELGCFYLTTSVPRTSVAGVTLGVSHHAFASTALTSRVDITSVSPGASNGLLRMSGEVRNSGVGATLFNAPIFYVQRADGVSIGCDYGFVTGSTAALASGGSTSTALAQGQSGAFAVTTHAPSNVTSLRSWVQWLEPNAADPLATLAEQTYDAMSRLPNTEAGKRQGIEAWEALQAQRRALARSAGQ